MTETAAVEAQASPSQPDPAGKNLAPHRPWWLTLIVLSATYALLVCVTLLVPAGTALWPIGLLATITTVLALYGPDVLSKLFASGPWFR